MADYIVTGPDGKKYKLTADSPEAVDHAVGQMFGGAAAPADEPKAGNMAPRTDAVVKAAAPPSLVDTIMSGTKDVYDAATSYGTQALAGVNKGIANMVGLPGDILAAVTGTKPTFGGEQVYETLFPAAPAPTSAGERITRRVGEEVGAMAVPIAGAGAKAARVGVEGARELGPFARMFVEPMAVAPGKTVAKEVTAATAGGGGAGLAGEYSGKNKAEAEGRPVTSGQQLWDLGGAVGGYTTGSLGAKIVDAGKTVGGALLGSRSLKNDVAREVATDEIVRAAGLQPNSRGMEDTGGIVAQLNIPSKAFEAVPDYKPTTADVTGNEGLAAKTYSKQSGENSGLYIQRQNENTAAVDRAVDANAPAGQPGAFKDALAVERDRVIGAASGAARDAEDQAAAAVRPITPHPNATRAGRGDTIRGEVDTAREAARQGTRDAYEAADVNAVPLQPTFLAEALDRTTQGLSQAERTMAPTGLIERIAQMPAGEPATLREATSLRTILVDQQRAALADPGRRYEARVLGQYIEAVEDVIGQSVSGEQRGLLEQARAARRAEAEAFERKGDPVSSITARNPGGVPKMRDENVARLSTRDDVMDRLFQEADTPATRAAIRDELVSNADTSSAAGIRAFQEQYGEQIARFPGLNDEIGQAIQARVRETTARGAESGVLKELGEGGRGVVAEYLRYGNENAEKAMRAVMANKDPAKAADELLTFAGDQSAAVEGARKVFWDIMQKDTKSAGSTTGTVKDNTQPFLPAKLKKFLEDPATAAVAARLYRDNPEHLENISKIAETLQNTNVHLKAKAPNTSGTAQGQSVLPSMETIASRTFAVQRGVVSPTFAAVNVLGIIARKAVAKHQAGLVSRIVDEALLKPDFAAKLLAENNPANRAALKAHAKGWIGNEASTLTQILQPDDEDAEIKGAVMRAK